MTTAQLITQGTDLAISLQREGRGNDAAVVVSLLDMASPEFRRPFLTVEAVSKRIGMASKVILNWIEKGSLDAIPVEDSYLVPESALSQFDELTTILDALDEDRPPATNNEIAAVLEADRRDWTWIGKEASAQS